MLSASAVVDFALVTTDKTQPALPNSLEPLGWNPPRHGNLAQWAAVFAAIVIALGNIGLTLYFHYAENTAKTSDEHVAILIDNKLQPMLKETNASINVLTDRISKVEGKLEILTQQQSKLTRLQIDKLSAQIRTARQINAKLQPEVVARLGQDLLELVGSKEKNISELAWRTANELADYRSILNMSEAPSMKGANRNPSPGGGMVVEWNAAKLPDSKEGMLGVFFIPGVPRVPGSQSALFIQIGNEYRNVSAPAFFIVDGTGFNIQLDGFHVRNAIVRNAKITYKGGPLVLENVYFVNCTFDVQQSDPGLKFASTLLTTAAMNFKQSS